MTGTPTRIVLLEDDDTFSAWIRDGLKVEFGEDLCVVEIATESEFLARLDELVKIPTDVFILDIRVRWTYVGSNVGPQPKQNANPAVAGLRCNQVLKAKQPNARVLLFSVLEQQDLNQIEDLKQIMGTTKISALTHIPKSDGLHSLINAILSPHD